ncbi:MAG TPA: hypothetical protein VFI19_17470 [Nocardioides sp.]|nr:hypothetical protein [Nocardioides sp.]
MSTGPASPVPDGVDLYWLPLGAGGRVVPRCGRMYERLSAHVGHRRAQPLFHSALEVTSEGTRYVVEMGPVRGLPALDRGVVREGPVGLRSLGVFRLFRYEVRCWPGGNIPDRDWAVGGPRRLGGADTAVRVLELVRAVPTLTWGRDELAVGDMWNSNSLVSWLLASSGVDLSGVAPPLGGRAPGWSAGIALAATPSTVGTG